MTPRNTFTIESSIDTSRLEKVRRSEGKIISRCPACATAGNDTTGDHFFLNTVTNQYGCAVFANDKGHRKEIFALVGIKGKHVHDPARDRKWRHNQLQERIKKQKQAAIIQAAKKSRDKIITRYAWPLADVYESSPQNVETPLVKSDPRHFLTSLFDLDAIVWTGEKYDSGKAEHSTCWKTVSEWQQTNPHTCGPFTTSATWKAATISRAAAHVASSPYTILDFDGFDNIHPKTPEEFQAHLTASLAIIRWLHEKMQWKLAAILYTGNKSLHAWFRTPTPEVLASLKPIAPSLGMDAGLIGRPEHPCRLPGHLHDKSEKSSRVLWLQHSAAKTTYHEPH